MTRNKGGRPKYEVDYNTLDKLCAIHCNGEECASILNIDYDTLNRALKRDSHGGFTEYFKKASAKGKMSLRRKQFEKATTEGSVPMLIWLGKQYLGQSDKVEHDNEEEATSLNITFGVNEPVGEIKVTRGE